MSNLKYAAILGLSALVMFALIVSWGVAQIFQVGM